MKILAFLFALFFISNLAAHETCLTTPSPNNLHAIAPEQLTVQSDGLYYKTPEGTLEKVETLFSGDDNVLFVRKIKKCKSCDRPLTCFRCYNPDCPLFRQVQPDA